MNYGKKAIVCFASAVIILILLITLSFGSEKIMINPFDDMAEYMIVGGELEDVSSFINEGGEENETIDFSSYFCSCNLYPRSCFSCSLLVLGFPELLDLYGDKYQ